MALYDSLIRIHVDGTSATKSLNDINNQLKAQQAQLRAYNASLDGTEDKLDVINGKLKTLNGTYTLQAQKLAELNRKRVEMEASGETENKKYLNLINSINRLTAEYTKQGREIDSLNAERELLENGMNDLNKEYAKVERNTRNITSSLRAMGNTVQASKAEYKGLRSQLDITNKQIDLQRNHLINLKRAHGENSKIVLNHESSLRRLEQRAINVRRRLSDMGKGVGSSTSAVSRFAVSSINSINSVINTVDKLGNVFKVGLVSSVGFAVSSIMPQLYALVNLTSGMIGALGTSIMGLVPTAVGAFSAIKGAWNKRTQLAELDKAIASAKSKSTSSSSTPKSTSTSSTSTSNNNAEKSRIDKETKAINAQKQAVQGRIDLIDEQIKKEEESIQLAEEKKEQEEELNRLYEERKDAYKELADIDKEIADLKYDRDLRDLRLEKQKNDESLRLINLKLKASNMENQSYDETQKLLERKYELEQKAIELKKEEKDKNEDVEKERLALIQKRQDKLKEISKIDAEINSTKKGKNSGESARLKALQAQKESLEKSLNTLDDKASSIGSGGISSSSLGSDDIGGISSGALASNDALNDLLKQREELLSNMTPEEDKLINALNSFGSWFNGWGKQFQVDLFPVIITGLGIVKQALITTEPLIHNTIKGIGNLVDSFGAYIATDFKNQSDKLTLIIENNITKLGKGIGWLINGLAEMSITLQPLTDLTLDWLIGMGKRFAEWGKSQEFADSVGKVVEWMTKNKDELMKNFSAWWNLGKGLSSLLITIGEDAIPVLTDFIKSLTKILKEVENWWKELPDGFAQLLVKISLFVTALWGIKLVLKGLLLPLTSLLKITDNVAKRNNNTSSNRSVGNNNNGGTIINSGNNNGRETRSSRNQGRTSIIGGLGSLGGKAGKALPYVGTALAVGTGIYGITKADSTQDKLASGISTAGTLAGGAIGGALGSLIAPGVGTAIGAGVGAWAGNKLTSGKNGQTLASWLLKATKDIKEWGSNSTKWVSDKWSSTIQGIQNVWNNSINGIKNVWNNGINGVKNISDSGVQGIKNTWNNSINWVGKKWSSTVQGISNGYNSLKTYANNYAQNARNNWESIKHKASGVWDGTKAKASSAYNSMVQGATNFGGSFSKSLNSIGDIASRFFSTIGEGMTTVATKVSEFLEGILGFSLLDKFKNLGSNIATSVKNGITSGISGFSWRNLIPHFAGGTSGTTADTLAIVNDQTGNVYRELVTYPNGQSIIPSGRNIPMYLPKGTRVQKASVTKALMRGIEYYENGIGNINNNALNRLDRLSQSSTSSQPQGVYTTVDNSGVEQKLDKLIDLMMISINQPQSINLNGKELNKELRGLESSITRRSNLARGI